MRPIRVSEASRKGLTSALEDAVYRDDRERGEGKKETGCRKPAEEVDGDATSVQGAGSRDKGACRSESTQA